MIFIGKNICGAFFQKLLVDDNVKRNFFLILILTVGLCNCSGHLANSRYGYSDEIETRKEKIWTWAATEKPRVETENLKDSDYWKLFYLKVVELRPDLDHYLFFADEMIKVSRIFEEGKITREQMEEKNQQLTDLLIREDNRRDAVLSRKALLRNYELTLLTCYKKSLFREYIKNLQRQLLQAGSQFSISHCTAFGDSIQCTALNPAFL